MQNVESSLWGILWLTSHWRAAHVHIPQMVCHNHGHRGRNVGRFLEDPLQSACLAHYRPAAPHGCGTCMSQMYWLWIHTCKELKGKYMTLRSAVGKTHDLQSDLWWTIPLHIILDRFGIPLGYSEIDQIHLSSEAQCVSHHLPQVDCHNTHGDI